MPKIRTNSLTSRHLNNQDGQHHNTNNRHAFSRSEQDTIHKPDSSTFTKRSRIVSFEDPQISTKHQKEDVTSSFLTSEFAIKTEEQSLSTNTKKPRTLSRLSRSGCLKSMAQGLCTQPVTLPTVSDENLSSSDSEEQELSCSRSMSEHLDNSSSTWGHFVDVVPVDVDTNSRRQRYIRSRSHSFPHNLFGRSPYSRPANRKNLLFKNDSYLHTTQQFKSTITDQISDALLHMRV